MAGPSFFTCNELLWLETVLESRFGRKCKLQEQESCLVLRLPGCESEIKFDSLQLVFHQSSSSFPCYQWSASKERFEGAVEDMLYAPSETDLQTPLIELHEKGAIIHYDILGLTYWMLTRLEEVGRSDLDEHQRFPAISSHAYKNNYLERPIVDEWLHILGQVIEKVWPNVELMQHKFQIQVSHDVDNPSQYVFKSWPMIGKMMVRHLIKDRDLKAFFSAPYVKLFTNDCLHHCDPFNTFDWLMEISEARDIQSAFYFICGRTEPTRDADYEPEHPLILNLMRRIHQRGHEIGLHPSYDTFQNPGLIRKEAERMRHICSEEGIEQEQWGGRMHYLRWEQPKTLRAWADAGMNYDSTLGYADRPGFRCGTCHEYQAFDPVEDELLNLRIKPLIAMDCTVVSDKYLGLGSTVDAYVKFKSLKDKCQRVGGTFTLLWHNSFFKTKNDFEIYQKLLS